MRPASVMTTCAALGLSVAGCADVSDLDPADDSVQVVVSPPEVRTGLPAPVPPVVHSASPSSGSWGDEVVLLGQDLADEYGGPTLHLVDPAGVAWDLPADALQLATAERVELRMPFPHVGDYDLSRGGVELAGAGTWTPDSWYPGDGVEGGEVLVATATAGGSVAAVLDDAQLVIWSQKETRAWPLEGLPEEPARAVLVDNPVGTLQGYVLAKAWTDWRESSTSEGRELPVTVYGELQQLVWADAAPELWPTGVLARVLLAAGHDDVGPWVWVSTDHGVLQRLRPDQDWSADAVLDVKPVPLRAEAAVAADGALVVGWGDVYYDFLFDRVFDPHVSWLYPPETAPSRTEQLSSYYDDNMSWSQVQITPDGEQVRACFCAHDFDLFGGGTTCECWHRDPSAGWEASAFGVGGAVALSPAGEYLHAVEHLGGVAVAPLGTEAPPVLWPATLAALCLSPDGAPRLVVRAEASTGHLYAPWP